MKQKKNFDNYYLFGFLIIIFSLILSSINYHYLNYCKLEYKVFDYSNSNSYYSIISQHSFAKSFNFYELQNSYLQNNITFDYNLESGRFYIYYPTNKFHSFNELKNFIRSEHSKKYVEFVKIFMDDWKNLIKNKTREQLEMGMTPPEIKISQNAYIDLIVILNMLNMENVDEYIAEQLKFHFNEEEPKLSFIDLFIGYLAFTLTVLISFFLIISIKKSK